MKTIKRFLALTFIPALVNAVPLNGLDAYLTDDLWKTRGNQSEVCVPEKRGLFIYSPESCIKENEERQEEEFIDVEKLKDEIKELPKEAE